MCGIPATWKIDFRARLSKVLVVFALSCLARRLGFNFGMRKWRLPRLGGCRLHHLTRVHLSGIVPRGKARVRLICEPPGRGGGVRRFHTRSRNVESPCGQAFAIAGREWRRITPRSPIETNASG